MKAIKFCLIVVFLIMSLLFSVTVQGSVEELKFRNPPASAKALTWWHWMNGNVFAEGYYERPGGDVTSRNRRVSGIPYLTANGRRISQIYEYELMVHIIKEAAHLGLEMGFHNCAG